MRIIEDIFRYLHKIKNQNDELIWAKVWDDTKKDIEWLKNMPGISPGRWAVGYNYLYVMTRVLNELEPRNILDIGLGISSTLISYYFSGNHISDGIHDVIEQDEEWVNFYSNKNRISSQTTIHVIECILKELNSIKYNAYQDISNVVKGKKYDVISIDAPKGSKVYSRRDIIDFIPEILNDSFVIIIDDSERDGEQNTVEEIKAILNDNHIKFCVGEYPGVSFCTVITSDDKKFVCSM